MRNKGTIKITVKTLQTNVKIRKKKLSQNNIKYHPFPKNSGWIDKKGFETALENTLQYF
jgi:hypothetical protein